MKTTIAGFSNEKLEQEIANFYVTGHKEDPTKYWQETGLLGLCWQEFDGRFAAGTIDRDSDYTEKSWDD